MPEFSIPVAILLIPYGLFVLFFLVYGAFTWYHLSRFGVMHGHLVAMRVLFLIGSITLLAISFLVLSGYDWTAPVTPSGIAGSSSLFPPL